MRLYIHSVTTHVLQNELREKIPTPIFHFYMSDRKLTISQPLAGISSGTSTSDTNSLCSQLFVFINLEVIDTNHTELSF